MIAFDIYRGRWPALDTPPVLKGYVGDKHGNLDVWCAYCREYHRHGKWNGHRLAHCPEPRSPYHATGYFIERTSEPKLPAKAQPVAPRPPLSPRASAPPASPGKERARYLRPSGR